MKMKFVIIFLFVCVAEVTVVKSQTIPAPLQASCNSPGIPGIPGVPGNYGLPGPRGLTGAKGERGAKGESGAEGCDYVNLVKSNWKQCVWKRVDEKDAGLIQNCIFNKKYDNTSLRVFYEGTFRSYGGEVCNRWYFTFDGAECVKPATIEGIVSVGTNENPHRHRHIEGYCDQVPKGHVRVGFWIGKCEGRRAGDGYTGWNAVSRIVIEEVPPPQA
ncbi:collagen triple helix repeat-containing protein 1-like [Dendronephthya gigantea]|uniref:collagen triple helix repeat-containing protein 1-like n=1 Tax=Dendronephthya gigantea TaxID=151771 RepID=UPI00106D570E|nr:collagen triple helix repeat-containing protein 1-like [Dendronephthya gigantea]